MSARATFGNFYYYSMNEHPNTIFEVEEFANGDSFTRCINVKDADKYIIAMKQLNPFQEMLTGIEEIING